MRWTQKQIIILAILLLAVVTVVYLRLPKPNDYLQSSITPTISQRNTNEDQTDLANQSMRLIIARINVDAPIILNVDGGNKKTYFSALENGVAHFKGTVLPGQKGNAFIFGHSAYYAWDPGKYKTIFAELNNLETGDYISIKQGESSLEYVVTEKKIVEPNNVSVLSPTPYEQLTLMTCWPPKTIEQRLIIIAKPK